MRQFHGVQTIVQFGQGWIASVILLAVGYMTAFQILQVLASCDQQSRIVSVAIDHRVEWQRGGVVQLPIDDRGVIRRAIGIRVAGG